LSSRPTLLPPWLAMSPFPFTAGFAIRRASPQCGRTHSWRKKRRKSARQFWTRSLDLALPSLRLSNVEWRPWALRHTRLWLMSAGPSPYGDTTPRRSKSSLIESSTEQCAGSLKVKRHRRFWPSAFRLMFWPSSIRCGQHGRSKMMNQCRGLHDQRLKKPLDLNGKEVKPLNCLELVGASGFEPPTSWSRTIARRGIKDLAGLR